MFKDYLVLFRYLWKGIYGNDLTDFKMSNSSEHHQEIYLFSLHGSQILNLWKSAVKCCIFTPSKKMYSYFLQTTDNALIAKSGHSIYRI